MAKFNNTSLALAIQAVDSGKVLLFPGDAEFGSWLSWHEKLSWDINDDGENKAIGIKDLLSKTVLLQSKSSLESKRHTAEQGNESSEKFRVMCVRHAGLGQDPESMEEHNAK